MYPSILKVSAVILLATSSSNAAGRFGVTPGNCAQKINQISTMADSPDKLVFAREILSVCGSRLPSNRVGDLNTIIDRLMAPPPPLAIGGGGLPPVAGPDVVPGPARGDGDGEPPIGPQDEEGMNAAARQPQVMREGIPGMEPQPQAAIEDRADGQLGHLAPEAQQPQQQQRQDERYQPPHEDAVGGDGHHQPAQHGDHEPLMQEAQGVNGEPVHQEPVQEEGHVQHFQQELGNDAIIQPEQVLHADGNNGGALNRPALENGPAHGNFPPRGDEEHPQNLEANLRPEEHYEGAVGAPEPRNNTAEEEGFTNNGQRGDLLAQIQGGVRLNPVDPTERKAARRANPFEDALRAGVLNRRGAVAGEGSGYGSDSESNSDSDWEN